MNTSLDAIPTMEEVQKAIHQLASGKAPGLDFIPAEVYKEGGTVLADKLLLLSKSYGRMNRYHRTSKTRRSSTSTKIKETTKFATTIVESLYYLSPVKSWPKSF